MADFRSRFASRPTAASRFRGAAAGSTVDAGAAEEQAPATGVTTPRRPAGAGSDVTAANERSDTQGSTARALAIDPDTDAFALSNAGPAAGTGRARRGGGSGGGLSIGLFPRGRFLDEDSVKRLTHATALEVQQALTGAFIRPEQALLLLRSRPASEDSPASRDGQVLPRLELLERLLLHLPAGEDARRSLLEAFPSTQRRRAEALVVGLPHPRRLATLQEETFASAVQRLASYGTAQNVMSAIGGLAFDDRFRSRRLDAVQLRELLCFVPHHQRLEALRALLSVWDGKGADVLLGAFVETMQHEAQRLLARPPTEDEVARLQASPHARALGDLHRSASPDRIRAELQRCISDTPLSAVEIAELVSSPSRAFSEGWALARLARQWDGTGDVSLVFARVSPDEHGELDALCEPPPPTRDAELSEPGFQELLSSLRSPSDLASPDFDRRTLEGRSFTPSQLRALLEGVPKDDRLDVLRMLVLRFVPEATRDGGVDEALKPFEDHPLTRAWAKQTLEAVRERRPDPVLLDSPEHVAYLTALQHARNEERDALLRTPPLMTDARPGRLRRLLGVSKRGTVSSVQAFDWLSTRTEPTEQLQMLKVLAPRLEEEGRALLLSLFVSLPRFEAAYLLGTSS